MRVATAPQRTPGPNAADKFIRYITRCRLIAYGFPADRERSPAA